MLTVIGYNSELTALLFPVAYLYLKLLVGLVRLSEISKDSGLALWFLGDERLRPQIYDLIPRFFGEGFHPLVV